MYCILRACQGVSHISLSVSVGHVSFSPAVYVTITQLSSSPHSPLPYYMFQPPALPTHYQHPMNANNIYAHQPMDAVECMSSYPTLPRRARRPIPTPRYHRRGRCRLRDSVGRASRRAGRHSPPLLSTTPVPPVPLLPPVTPALASD